MKRTRLIQLLLLLAFTAPLSAQTSFEILLKRGNLSPEPNIRQSYLDTFNSTALRAEGKGFAVLQFGQLPGEDMKSKLAAAGITLLDYLPHGAFTISFSGNLQAAPLKAAGARALIALPPGHKMDDYLARGYYPSWAVKAAGTVDAWIAFPKTFTAASVSAALRQMEVEVVSGAYQSYRVLHIRLATAKLQLLAAQPFIEYIQAAPGEDKPLNYNSRAVSRAGLLNTAAALGGRGLRGEGVVIGVGDNADIQTHMDFKNRIIPRASSAAAGHGTHVSGIVAGGGNINELYTGTAPKATLIGETFSGVLLNAPAYVQDHGMVITNNSYGDIIECDYYGTYDLTSRILDQMAFDFPHLQNVFAAGNSGTSVCTPFAQGYRTVFGGYQSAKNVITVGSTTDSGMISSFSSRGPLRDGRTKPELVAMGSLVASTWPGNIYSYNNGTSMAAPAVSGGLGLLYQRYRQLHGGANPKTGLVKALLSNGAADRGQSGPDYLYGYGWMNLLRSIEMLEGQRYFEGAVSTGTTNTHSITVPPNTAQLKVLLYWNDPAAAAMSSRALVHDLDLKVTGPGGTITLPLVLDTTVTGVSAAATTGVDRINNMEQVVIAAPQAGTYQLGVQGHAVAQSAQQEYFLVYDAVPAALQVTAPAAGEAWAPSTFQYDMMKIAWETAGYAGNVTIAFSADDGATWATVATGIPAARGLHTWWVPGIPTAQGRIRITKESGGESALSGRFTILAQPSISLDAVQCEGYIRLNWTSVAGADDYEVMWLQGEEMVRRALVTGNTYTFSGLSKDSTYWITVRARREGRPGRRTQAISRQPDNGSCSGSISDGDLKLDAILSPVSGRAFTSTAPGNATAVQVRIKNLDNAPVTGFTLSYSVNGGPLVAETVAATIAAGATYDHVFAQPADLSATGSYRLVTIVRSSSDPVAANDTAVREVRHLENAPLDLSAPFVDALESAASFVYGSDTTGLAGISRYDFRSSTPLGRLRTFVNSGIAYSGEKALTLDAERSIPAGNTSYLTATYNLGSYGAAADDVRLDFQQLQHGQKPHADNRVWIRGNDTSPWIEVYDLAQGQGAAGVYVRSGSIELGDWLAAAGQDFSTSFQVRWGQQGTMPATDRFVAAGYTLDDIRLYMAVNDMQLRSIDAPIAVACALGAATPVTVSVRNSANTAVNNVPVRYRVDNGGWVTETIPAIGPNATVQYSFAQGANLSLAGAHAVQVVVDFPGDNFRDNDTALLQLYNAPQITAFPYLENFEGGQGHWYSGGKKSSWGWGTPASPKLGGAASGTKAWKTGLQAGYHNEELSYLYSPCFNLSGLNRPALSFSFSLDIEDCGTSVCDAAWVEYSADGLSWTKLGNTGTGTNWYNHATQVWSLQQYSYWHVATIALPQNLSQLRLRFVFASDAGLTREGIAIDDVHIYDYEEEILEGTITGPVSKNVSGSGWTHFSSGGQRIASIAPGGQSLGTTAVEPFIHPGAVRNNGSQYYHNRSLVIRPGVQPADSVTVHFYFLDAETDSLVKAAGCAGCDKPASAYELGVSKYSDPDPAFINGSISDNQQGMWQFIPREKVEVVPYGKGYYVAFRVKDFSEFWLNSGGLDRSVPLPVKLLDFKAVRDNDHVVVDWQVYGEQQMLRYEVELARGADALQAGTFEKIGAVAATNAAGTRDYTFTDTEAGKSGTRYYRLKMVDADGGSRYTPVRAVTFEEGLPWQVFPNPSDGTFFLLYQVNNNEVLQTRLYDAAGRLINAAVHTGNGSLQKLEVDLSAKAAGIYLLRVEGGGRKQSYKLYRH